MFNVVIIYVVIYLLFYVIFITFSQVSVQVNHIQVATLGAGSFFGEMSLLSNERRSATVSAIKDTTCLVLSRADFQEHLGPLEEVSILDINILYHGITSCMVVQNIATLEFISCTVFL